MYLIEIPIAFPEGRCGHISMGSVFHGALMQLVGSEAAAQFHQRSLRPYRQCILPQSRGKSLWQFGILTDEAYDVIMGALSSCREIYLRQQHCAVTIGVPQIVQHTTYAALMKAHLGGSVPRSGQITYLTPTTFKQQGRYVVLPDARLILQSLLVRWNAFASEPLEEGIAEILGYYAQLRQYDIQSRVFGVERQHIPGCLGSMSFAFGGDEMVRRTISLLWDFATISGIGIKTALGMGAVQTKIER